MWHGYFKLAKAAGFSTANKTALSACGVQSPTCSCQCTSNRYRTDNKEVMCEMCLSAEPQLSDYAALSVDSITIFGGGGCALSIDCCAAADAYISAHAADWHTEL